MQKEFIESNIVILGEFQPAKFDKLFFVKNNLIAEEDFLDGTIITSSLVKITTKKLIINIVQNQIILVNKSKTQSILLKQISENIISESNSTITAVGFNFKWFLFMDDVKSHTKSKFYSTSNTVLNKHFDSTDTAYGFYVSKDFLNSRMKLDVKPKSLKEINSANSRMILSFDFNFHIDNSSNKDDINKSIDNYNSYRKKAQEIIKDYE